MIKEKFKQINELNFEIDINDCFNELKPHPKFDECTFDNYKNDERYPSQLELKNTLRNICVAYIEARKNKGFTFFSKGRQGKIWDNLYIDGTYGIGKTHLLSACFKYFSGSKAFMSFMELTYFMNYLGLEKTIELFKPLELLLIDEFDLDDPATTRMAARFIAALNERTVIITTSNRLPKELGGGKFDTTQFERELGTISQSFKNMTVEGESFRINLTKWKAEYSNQSFSEVYENYGALRGKALLTSEELLETLKKYHPFRFFIIPKNIDAIFIKDFKPFVNLNDALRFAVLLDYCYYYDTKLFFSCELEDEIFPKEMMETSFERQFLRCQSRITELGIFFSKGGL